jgi:hypothetical protein
LIWVVVLCGVISGAAALGFGWWGHAEALLATESLNPMLYGLVVLAIHLVALAAIGGGLAVLVSPRVGRIAMLSSAVGWLVLTAFLGGGVRPGIGLVILLTGAGGLAAFLPGLQVPRFRLERDRDLTPAFRPKALARNPERRPLEPSIVPPFEADRVEPVEDHSKPFVPPPDYDAYPAAPVVERSSLGRDLRREPDFDFRRGGPVRERARRPARRSNVRASFGIAALALLIAAVSGVLILDIPLPQGNSITPVTPSVPAASPASSAPHASTAAPATSSASEEQARLPGGQLPAFTSSTETAGDRSVASMASLPPIEATTDEPTPTMTASGELPPVPLPPLGTLAAVPQTPTTDGRYETPFAYCAALANADAPDASRIAGGLRELTASARQSASMPNGEVRWRCMDGAVWVCVAPVGALSCDKLPTAADRVLICAAHPDSTGVRTAGGDWSCDGFTPVVTPAQLNAGDHRGFDKSVWTKLAEPRQAAG